MTELHVLAGIERPPVQTCSPGLAEPTFIEALIDPVSVFADPDELAAHAWFSDEEKRTILLSWARDELAAVQVAAGLPLELRPQSRIDAVLDALSRFDEAAAREYRAAAASIRARSGRARTPFLSQHRSKAPGADRAPRLRFLRRAGRKSDGSADLCCR
jgi:hypothetical protein